MNLILWIIDAVVAFVTRNPIFCLVVLILAIGAPSLLAGIASFILYIILALVIVMVVVSLILRWRIAKLSDDFRRQAGSRYGGDARQNAREGDVHIYVNNEPAEKRINDDVGDYVDFEEEKKS